MPSAWPPPRRPDDVWVRRRAGTEVGAPVVALRQARLWDRAVLIDEAGDVWCSGCLRTVTLAELLAWDSSHSVRPPGGPRLSRSGPLTRDDVDPGERLGEVPAWRMSW